MTSLAIVLGSVLLGFLFCTAIVAVLAINAPLMDNDYASQSLHLLLKVQLAEKGRKRKQGLFFDLSA